VVAYLDSPIFGLIGIHFGFILFLLVDSRWQVTGGEETDGFTLG